MASTTFLFLRATPLIAEQWRAASRATSASAGPGAGSSRLPRFTQPRYLQERPTTAELPRRCIVRINEHGSEDRVKDASRSACDGVPCLRPVPTLSMRRPTAFPSSATYRTSAVTGALDTRGGSRLYRSRADQGLRSNDAPRRASPFRRPGCLQPPRHAKECYAERLLPPAFAPALPLTPPTLFPQAGESALVGHCKCHGTVTRDP